MLHLDKCSTISMPFMSLIYSLLPFNFGSDRKLLLVMEGLILSSTYTHKKSLFNSTQWIQMHNKHCKEDSSTTIPRRWKNETAGHLLSHHSKPLPLFSCMLPFGCWLLCQSKSGETQFSLIISSCSMSFAVKNKRTPKYRDIYFH